MRWEEKFLSDMYLNLLEDEVREDIPTAKARQAVLSRAGDFIPTCTRFFCNEMHGHVRLGMRRCNLEECRA